MRLSVLDAEYVRTYVNKELFLRRNVSLKVLAKEPLNLMIAGVGGQGNVSMSALVGRSLVKRGYFATVFDSYGASQRLGAVASHVKISKEMLRSSPLILKGEADIIVSLEPLEALRTLVHFGNPDVITITNPRPVYPIDVISGEAEYPDLDKAIETIARLSAKSWIVDATGEALKLGSPLLANTVLLGSLIGLDVLPLDKQSVELVLREQFPKTFNINMRGLNKGLDLVRQTNNG